MEKIHVHDPDVSVGSAVGVVAGAAAGELVSVAGTVAGAMAGRLKGAGADAAGALGAALRDARAGNVVGGVVGGAGARWARSAVSSVVSAPPPPSWALRARRRRVVATSTRGFPPNFPPRRRSLSSSTSRANFYTRRRPPTTPRWRARRPSCSSARPRMLPLNPGNGRDRSRPSTNPSTSSLSATRDAVATIRLLPSFGVDLAPARLASTKEKDPMDIVRACLAADPRRAHRRVDDLDALGRLVGVDGGDIIAARGRAALAAGDGDAAAAAAEELVARRVASAWDVVADVVAAAEFADAEDVAEDGGDVGDVGCGAGARVGADAANGGSGEYDASASSPGWTPPDAAARRKFQAFALAHAPADRAPELLAAWQNMETTRFAERAIETREGDEGADANSDPSNLDDPSTALRVAAPDLRASATTRPRPRLRAFAERYLPRLLASATVASNGDAASAAAYGLGATGVAASDAIFAAAAVAASRDELALGLLLGLDAPAMVADAVKRRAETRRDAAASANLGALAHAFRLRRAKARASRVAAIRLDPDALLHQTDAETEAAARNDTGNDTGNDSSEVRQYLACRVRSRATSDAETLARALPGTVSASKFVADDEGAYRAACVSAYAASARDAATRRDAFRMAREYGANAAEVAAAHVAGSFAAGSDRLDDSLDDAAAELDRAFATAPDLAASLLRRDAWRALPRAGADGAETPSRDISNISARVASRPEKTPPSPRDSRRRRRRRRPSRASPRTFASRTYSATRATRRRRARARRSPRWKTPPSPRRNAAARRRFAPTSSPNAPTRSPTRCVSSRRSFPASTPTTRASPSRSPRSPRDTPPDAMERGEGGARSRS